MSRRYGSRSKLSAEISSPVASVESIDQEPRLQRKSLSPFLRKLADEIEVAILSVQKQFEVQQKEINNGCVMLSQQLSHQESELGDDVKVALLLSRSHSAGGSMRINNELRASISKKKGELDRLIHHFWQLDREFRRSRDALEQLPAISLPLGQFKEANTFHVLAAETWRVRVEMSLNNKRVTELRASIQCMEAEYQHRIIADLCSGVARPDKAQIGFRMHLAQRCERLIDTNAALAEVFKRKAAIEKELVDACSGIQRRLDKAVRLQAELDVGGGKK